MKLSPFRDLETSKRALTMGRIAIIAGAHLVVIGGAYFVTNFGGETEGSGTSVATALPWSNQSAGANEPSVDAAADSLFDERAEDLSGYNAVDGEPVTFAASQSATAPRGGRFAPRRPESSGSASSNQPASSANDPYEQEVLQPLNRPGANLYPTRSPASSEGSNLSDTIEYKVQNGDSLWGIHKRFNVSIADITSANPGLKADSIRVGQVIRVPRSSGTLSMPQSFASEPTVEQRASRVGGSVYTVKGGDSLSKIASRQGTTVAELKALNGLSNDMIRIGQELMIPTKTSSATLVANQHRGPTVTVKSGDTLDKFAAVYGVSVAEIMQLNDIQNPRLVRIGQTLLIPEGSSKRVSSTQIQTPRTQPTQPSQAQQTPPSRTQELPTLQTLDTLETQDEDSLPSLDSLGEPFDEDDLEERPLIPISE